MQLYHKNVIWGLNDSAIFASWGSSIYSIEVCHSLPSLQFLARHVIKESIEEGQEKQLQLLPLPKKEIMQLSLLKAPIVPVSIEVINSVIVHGTVMKSQYNIILILTIGNNQGYIALLHL